MNINDFAQFENYEGIISDGIFEDVFYMDYVEEIELSEEKKKYIEWLSYFFVAEMQGVLDEINELDMLDQISVFDFWFKLIQSRDEVEALARTIIYYKSGIPV
ncbi:MULTISPECIES: hypothetical protein [Enterobacteriaceae]|uniref:hypothetical protein n=1 Tax=Enterobacteriaceae TaxID=543 RepID=UPI0009B1334E|nr:MULTISPECIES: hypothetical protein [Enterobacteriaceae]MBA3215804.1 hypothetical protein [Salmonella enterica]EGB5539433.1 hypothetical protein [Escherichia coli]HBE6236192.1 hypothetical protein [Escherichia coli]HBE6247512.1 hypothetical protein [Escherichia coli]HBE6249474.1 hypothetical protein [Escherichia coli]